ncbi:MAG: 4Fe-4S dicluster domain-containing protein, partial [Defluviitaleaceae bacterium]|nr:4Fe-4S dicluster domain-containing protein [Defluviitaleaceae bacterium]
AAEMLNSGVGCVLAWRDGDFPNSAAVGFFTNAADAANLVYNSNCGANLSKYLIDTIKQFDKTLVFLKPCDVYSYNQLIKENLIDPDKIIAIGIGCGGDMHKGCQGCEKIDFPGLTEIIGGDLASRNVDKSRFAGVLEIEGLDSGDRHDFWRGQLSRCVRCNACRQVCPVCNCKKCIFDNPHYDAAGKANPSSFEEQQYHLIRAYHAAGRCTDCGQCTRACPQAIDLNLLNRKFIKDINELYGEYQAGADPAAQSPLTSFEKDDYDPTGIL